MVQAISPALIAKSKTGGNSVRIAMQIASICPAAFACWILWFAPLGPLEADRAALAARDFTALWAAGHLALDGATAALAQPALFTAWLRGAFGIGMPNQIWPYPPPILLLAAPLATLPLLPAFLLYSAAGLALFWRALRLAFATRTVCIAALLSPAVAENMLIGQNGVLTASILVAGLHLLDRRPALAGALLGMLVIKPQFALLLPICLVAGRRWTAAATGLATALATIAASIACFGTGTWMAYLVEARPAIAAYLSATWTGDGSQRLFVSTFMAARSLGAGLELAYALQIATTLVCAALAWRAWRRAGTPPNRIALSLALTCAASPWVHAYDTPILAVAILMLAPHTRPAYWSILAIGWLWPGLAALVDVPTAAALLSIGSIVWLAAVFPGHHNDRART